MTWHVWWLFSGIVLVLCAMPGPNMLLVLNRSAQEGFKRSVAAMLGCASSLLLVLCLSACGLGAALVAAPRVFGVLRVVGAFYLIYLGLKAWWGSFERRQQGGAIPQDTPQPAAGKPALSVWALWRNGFLVGLSNPKFLLFATAFFPQFITPGQSRVPQFVILITTFLALELLCYLAYAAGGVSLARLLVKPALRKAFERISGTIFLGFGAGLLKARF